MTSPVESVVFNNSEEWLGAGSRSGTFKVFDLNENKGMLISCSNHTVVVTPFCLVVRSISGHKASIRALDFHRYGDILASGSLDTNIKV